MDKSATYWNVTNHATREATTPGLMARTAMDAMRDNPAAGNAMADKAIDITPCKIAGKALPAVERIAQSHFGATGEANTHIWEMLRVASRMKTMDEAIAAGFDPEVLEAMLAAFWTIGLGTPLDFAEKARLLLKSASDADTSRGSQRRPSHRCERPPGLQRPAVSPLAQNAPPRRKVDGGCIPAF